MTAAASEETLPAPRFRIPRLLKTAAIVAGCAAIVAFVLLPIGRPATRTAEPAPVDATPAKAACGERPREILIDGRRVEAYEVVCGDGATALAALPVEELPPTWSTSSSEAPVEEPAASVEEPPKRPPAVVPRAKPKPRPKAERTQPRRSVAAATSISQEKYGP
jgi:hypothetical protein